MDIAVKIVTVFAGAVGVIGLLVAFKGGVDAILGFKNDNGQQMDNGIKGLVLGGAMAGMAAGLGSAIIAGLSALGAG